MNKQNVGLHEIRVIPGTQVVCNHKAGQLVNAQVLIRKEGGIHLMSTKKQASVDVGRDHDGDVTQMVSAQGDTQKNHNVENEKSISTRKPPLEVPLRVVTQV